MNIVKRYLPLSRIVMILAVSALVIGTVFVVQGVTKAEWMKDAMRLEVVTVGIDENLAANGDVVDSGKEAQIAGDTIREHRRSIAPTYGDLLGEGRYDPTNPQHLSYAQALNMENYLYLAVLGFGVTDIVIAAGAFMIITGIALGATSLALSRARPG
ncbi:MAG: hypothetical protein MUP21_14215 [Dehalococcoidia bacterium]|nr:hypothetical protein [Dehalococcoidia bacterium]